MVGVAILLAALRTAAQSPCLESIKNDIMAVKDVIQGKGYNHAPLIRFWYSGKEPNDLGHYQSCVDREDSEYFLLMAKDTDFPIAIGVCAPAGCTAEEISSFFTKSDELEYDFGDNIHFEATPLVNYELGVGGWIAIALAGLLVCLVAYGTWAGNATTKDARYKAESSMQLREFSTSEAVEAPLNTDIHEVPSMRPQTEAYGLLTAFSLLKSYGQLTKNNNPNSILPLNGVRVLAFCWIVLGQLYVIRLHGLTINLEDIEDFSAEPSTAIGYGALTAINTMFWLSGFLAGFGLIKLMETNSLSWKASVGLRVARLLPVLLFCLAFNMFVLPAIGFGPQWGELGTDFTEECSSYWWTNLLGINNVVPELVGNLCYLSSWAVAVNLQLYVLAPLWVLLYVNKPKVFLAVALGCSLGALGFTAFLAWELEVDVNYLYSDRDFDLVLLNKPYFHFLPFLVGLYMSLVYYMHRQGEANSDPAARLILNTYTKNPIAPWISLGFGLVELNLNLFSQVSFYSGTPYRGTNVFYLTQAQFSDSVALTLILMPVLFNCLPKVANVLSLEVWGPLSRLTFCAYMMHEAVMRAVVKGEQTGYYWTHMSLFNDLMFFVVLSYLAALPLFFLVEAPCYSLLKRPYRLLK